MGELLKTAGKTAPHGIAIGLSVWALMAVDTTFLNLVGAFGIQSELLDILFPFTTGYFVGIFIDKLSPSK